MTIPIQPDYLKNQNSEIDSKVPNRQDGGLNGGLAEKIMSLIRLNSSITVAQMSETLKTPKRTVEREMKKLCDSNRIEREGGKRFGKWKILD